MKNQTTINLFDELADYYTLLNDSPRVRAFRSAARNLELISFEITASNLKDVDLKSLGKSTREVLEEYLTTGKVQRLEELKTRLPPLRALDLLQLYNFDLQFIFELWDKHKAANLAQLYTLRADPRVRLALDVFSSLDMSFTKLPEAAYPLLGDMAVQSAFGSGHLTIDQICTIFKDRDYKHGFIADFCESSNVLGGLSKEKILSQRQVIKEAQIKHNIRIWQGLIVDVDLEGNAPLEHAALVDYTIIRPSTRPHENLLSRVSAAGSKLPGAFVDVLDKYCTTLDRAALLQLMTRHPLIIHSPDYVTASRILDFIKDIPPVRVGLVSYAKTEQEFDQIYLAQDLVHRLLYGPNNLINCAPHPFKAETKYSSIVGVREGTPPKEDTLKRLEATLQRIQQLQSTNNHLGQLFQKDKK